MFLSAREQRILNEIDQDLTAAEPRLARALISAQRIALVRRPLVAGSWWNGSLWAAIIVASMLAGIALLTIGLISGLLALAWAGLR